MTVPVRKAKVGIVTLAGATLLGAFPVVGQQVANATTDRAAYLAEKCDHIKDNAVAAGCYTQEAINWNRAQSAIARERGAAAREQTEKNEEASRCIVFLTEGVKSGRFDKAEIHEKAGGKLSVENACPVATKHFNYQRKAEIGKPAVK